MEGRLCPICSRRLEIEEDEVVSFDPLVSLEIVSYRCPVCGHREKAEYLR